MIENERQYRVTRAAEVRFTLALDAAAGRAAPPDIHPRLIEAQQDAMRSQLDDLRAELRDYERSAQGGTRLPAVQWTDGPRSKAHRSCRARSSEKDVGGATANRTQA